MMDYVINFLTFLVQSYRFVQSLQKIWKMKMYCTIDTIDLDLVM